jgi:hypothetical protein
LFIFVGCGFFFIFLRKFKRDAICEMRSKASVDRKVNFIVGVRGGRFEVDLVELTRRAVYWDETKTSQVRRCLWFYKENNDQQFVPYGEDYSDFLEVSLLASSQFETQCFSFVSVSVL